MSPYPHVPLECREPLQLEYENGKLVKINGMRPECMDGYRLLDLVRQMADALNGINATVFNNRNLSHNDYFKVRYYASFASPNAPKSA